MAEDFMSRAKEISFLTWIRIKRVEERERERGAFHLYPDKKKVKELNGELSTLSGADSLPAMEINVAVDPQSRMIQFLMQSIREKEKDLECPVCLEEARAPIYSCLESPIICSTCQSRVERMRVELVEITAGTG